MTAEPPPAYFRAMTDANVQPPPPHTDQERHYHYRGRHRSWSGDTTDTSEIIAELLRRLRQPVYIDDDRIRDVQPERGRG